MRREPRVAPRAHRSDGGDRGVETKDRDRVRGQGV